MKKLLGLFICMCVAAVLTMGTTGCTKDKPKADGSPKVKADATAKDDKKPVKDHEVAVKADPTKITDAKPSETRTAKLKLTRGKDATHEVTFAVKSDKDGVTATAAKVAGDKSEGELSIEVDKKAKDGDYVVTVTASSKESKEATAMVTVTVKGKEVVVEPKKDFSLTVTGDDKAVTIKQGDKGKATLTVKLGKDVEEAKLTVKDGKGVKATVDPAKMTKSGDVTVNITVDADAAAGDASVTIEAAAEGATTASAKVAIKVDKK
jgi:uncharacterized membrane protein